jgi:NhaA family Na+:H+ antiporter
MPVITGFCLFLSAAAALFWANSAWSDAYHRINDTVLTVHIGAISIPHTINAWINDGVMVLFFFLVGLEIKHQLVHGELGERRKALLPIAAALGGMLGPALIYLSLNAAHPESVRGWGIPVATDIAFALGVLALLGARVPASLRIFLLTLATADDIGGILVIAVFYSSAISYIAMAAACLLALIAWLLGRNGVHHGAPYLIVAIALWAAVFVSGVHPTIAGVVIGLLIPARARDNQKGIAATDSLNERLQRVFAPWVNWLVLPIFALSNSGVEISSALFHKAVSHPAASGIFLGLLFGKFVGTFGFSWLAVRFKLADLPTGANWRLVAGTCILTGIGFTVSLFIAQLAFQQGPLIAFAKLAVLSASLIAALGGFLFLRFVPNKA